MDLSKAFDCLPLDFTTDKLSAYGLSDTVCAFIHSYLSDRKQLVKLRQHHSSWLNTIKGVPQGSILLFNNFINDIFFIFLCQTVHFI